MPKHTKIERRPGPVPHVPPTRQPKWGFGQTLRARNAGGRDPSGPPEGFVGRVDTIYADYWAALDVFIVPPGWFEMQNVKPLTKDQIFYGLTALDGSGAILAGENDVEEA